MNNKISWWCVVELFIWQISFVSEINLMMCTVLIFFKNNVVNDCRTDDWEATGGDWLIWVKECTDIDMLCYVNYVRCAHNLHNLRKWHSIICALDQWDPLTIFKHVIGVPTRWPWIAVFQFNNGICLGLSFLKLCLYSCMISIFYLKTRRLINENVWYFILKTSSYLTWRLLNQYTTVT